MDDALRHRLTAVVAGAGFGKSTLLASWATANRAAWYTAGPEDAALGTLAPGLVDALRLRLPRLSADVAAPTRVHQGPDHDEAARAEAFAGLLAETLDGELTSDLAVIVDDVEEVGPDGPGARLIEALTRHAPPMLHLVLSSRSELPFPTARLRGRGQLLELGGPDLAFGPEEVADLLRKLWGDDPGDLPKSVLELTGGWPAAVRLTAETLRGIPPVDRAKALAGLGRPGGPIFVYLAEEALAREGPEVRDLLRRVARLERFTADLCETALGIEGAGKLLEALARRGLFVERRGLEEWFTLTALVREFAQEYLPLQPDELRAVCRRAGAWFERAGRLEEALDCLARAGDPAAVARLLAERGSGLLAAGAAEKVIRAADGIPEEDRDAGIWELLGLARHARGDWEGALMCFRRAVGGRERPPAGLAWRMGLIHHLRGDLEGALAVYGEGTAENASPEDQALLAAWTASAHWLRGETEACRGLASSALRAATASGSPRALAATHTVLAMLAALDGDRAANDVHYLQALEAAERAGDVFQIIRIRTNRGSRFIEEGDYEEALQELEVAIRLADLAGFPALHGLALCNRAEARMALGRLDEAAADYGTAKGLYQRLGSNMLCYALSGLGEAYRRRGDLSLARAAYQEAIALAEKSGDVQGLVPALSGLALVMARADPEQAASLAEEAVAHGTGLSSVTALLAAGWVALARGERGEAEDLASRAEEMARGRRDRSGLAEAIELSVLAAPDPSARAARLEEAVAIWREIGDPLGTARARLALARLSSGPGARALEREALQALRDLGVRRGGAPVSILDLEPLPPAPVVIRSMGGFQVLRDGRAVEQAEWQSRKARDLLKILVARRGRPTPRDVLMEALWPGEDPARLANRLSVALTTVRTVLDPDHRFPAGHFLVADRATVALDLDHLAVDVEYFLESAAEGLRMLRKEAAEEAATLLAAAEAAYAGEFLEEDAYEDWTVPLREEARATYIAVLRTLALSATGTGDHDAAVRYRLRILERDPFDEDAHLGLVGTLVEAGRHGEARRHYRHYVDRMGEIGVEAHPFPELRRQA